MLKIYKFCPLCGRQLSKATFEGKKLLTCKKCLWVNYQNPLPVAVAVAYDSQNKVLAAKRGIEPGINKWALPGGFIESGENSESACIRELSEETGLKGSIDRLLGVYIHRTKMYGPVLVIGYAVKVLKKTISLNNELRSAAFFKKQDLPYIPFSAHRKLIENFWNK